MIKLFFLLLFSIAAGPGFSEELPVFSAESVEFEPEILRTGGNGFCRIKTREPLDPLDAQSIEAAADEWFEIREIRLSMVSNEILIWFVPFNPFSRYLPEIKTGRFRLEKIALDIEKTVEPGDRISQPPDAVLIPGTRLYLAFIFFAASSLVFILFYSKKLFYYPLGRKVSEILLEREKKDLLLRMKRLDPGKYTDKPGLFCLHINNLFKNYLERIYCLPFTAYTSCEINGKLRCLGVDKALVESLEKSLCLSDRIRFGNDVPVKRGALNTIAESVILLSESVYNTSEEEKGT